MYRNGRNIKTNFEQICELLAAINNPEEINLLLRSLFTAAELADLNSRWEIVKRLNRGDSQRAIASELRLGLCKITRGSKELKKPNSILKKIINKIEQKQV